MARKMKRTVCCTSGEFSLTPKDFDIGFRCLLVLGSNELGVTVRIGLDAKGALPSFLCAHRSDEKPMVGLDSADTVSRRPYPDLNRQWLE